MGPLIQLLWNPPGIYLLIAFACFFAGYATGRRQGKREGISEGVRYAPLEMRRQTWERGHCVICGAKATDQRAVKRGGGAEEDSEGEERT